MSFITHSFSLLTLVPAHEPESYLIALFDVPFGRLRLAFSKESSYVGMERFMPSASNKGLPSVSRQDSAHHRDIFFLQAAVCIWDPRIILASVIERYSINN